MSAALGPSRAFHVQRAARDRYRLARPLIGLDGDLVTTDLPAIRRLAGAMGGSAADIGALGTLHEIGHLLVARQERLRPGTMADAAARLRDWLGRDARPLLDGFAREFPGVGPDPEPEPVRLEELLLTRVANENPAAGPLRELVDDRPLARTVRYDDAVAALDLALRETAPDGGETLTRASLFDLLRLPGRVAPESLAAQLRYIREAWPAILGDDLAALLARIDLAIGLLAEEAHSRALRGAGVGPGLDLPAGSWAASFGGVEEPEAFSVDSAWMPRLVLIAKSTYVWLDQLSRAHGRDIRTLDAIPDDELDQLASWGVTGLWLIGLWERSRASERIKRMRGNADAVASAYSLDDYVIAADLGGEAALEDLRGRAAARGIRLASDMVPNHMGIDSRWLVEHPEWFLSVDGPPFPAYRFTGPDLSSDERVGIVLEDHYWDDTDAAVVFERTDRRTGERRYVYHGNDGTSFPWNDTAQLDFLQSDVREQVIRTILDVARRFPVIRFDAAMVLAKRHIERLWWPEPGHGAGIPSRTEHALPKAVFDARMPREFWREVVDRVAAEVPGTLLLAEAFWMLEGYFVRTLGMHRVYNSAFMHMLRDENGEGYRRVIKETIEFDPEILKRFVNFMSNPDEETAVEQFGTGDKYFGVATVMATLPGLPMLGHGQVFGFAEKYGMEYRRARLDERPDPSLVARHEREIFPLLHRRSWFAEARDFLLYDLVRDDGSVDEHVYAYSNGSGPERSIVLYHDRFATTSGWIRESAPYARRTRSGSKRIVRRSLADGLGLPTDPGAFVTFRDARTGLESIRSCREVRDRGLHVTLEAYESHVLWELHEVRDGIGGQWARLAARLGERAVPSLDAAMRELQLEPVHAPLRAVLAGESDQAGIEALYGAVAEATGSTGIPPRDLAQLVAASTGPGSADDVVRAWSILEPMGRLAPGRDPIRTSRAWFDELWLHAAVADGLEAAGVEPAIAHDRGAVVRVLLHLPRPSTVGGARATRDRRLIDAWLADDVVREAMGINAWEGVEWFDRDRFVELLAWADRLDRAGGAPADPGFVPRLTGAAEAAGYRSDALRAALAAGGPRRPRNARRRTGSTP